MTAQPANPPDADRRVDQIYRAHFRTIWRYVRGLTRNLDLASELAQESFVRFARLGNISEVDSPEAYLKVIARNLVRDHADSAPQRSVRLQVPLDQGSNARKEADQHKVLEDRELLALCIASLDELPSDTRRIFLLSRLDGFTYTEIAAQMNAPLWIVQRHMIRARRHIERFRQEHSV